MTFYPHPTRPNSSDEARPIHWPDAWHTADLLAFSGRSLVSLSIKVGTCSPISHVAAIAWTPGWQLRSLAAGGVIKLPAHRFRQWNDRHLLYESTTLSEEPCQITGQRIQGVQAHPPVERIARYDGRVRLYRLTPAWRHEFTVEKATRLTGHLLARIGQHYDGRGAILAGTRVVKHFWAWRLVDRSSLFCSEYLAAVLQHVGLFPISNASKVTPASLVKLLVEAEVYEPGVVIK